MSAVIRTETGFRLLVKGAPETLLPLCEKQIASSGVDQLTSVEKVDSTMSFVLSMHINTCRSL